MMINDESRWESCDLWASNTVSNIRSNKRIGDGEFILSRQTISTQQNDLTIYIHTNIRTLMFMKHVFIIVSYWRQPRLLLINECINKLHIYIYTIRNDQSIHGKI